MQMVVWAHNCIPQKHGFSANFLMFGRDLLDYGVILHDGPPQRSPLSSIARREILRQKASEYVKHSQAADRVKQAEKHRHATRRPIPAIGDFVMFWTDTHPNVWDGRGIVTSVVANKVVEIRNTRGQLITRPIEKVQLLTESEYRRTVIQLAARFQPGNEICRPSMMSTVTGKWCCEFWRIVYIAMERSNIYRMMFAMRLFSGVNLMSCIFLFAFVFIAGLLNCPFSKVIPQYTYMFSEIR